MLIPEFMGGLGNMMFQLASTYGIAKKTNHSFGIIDIPLPPSKHSTMDYKTNIFKDWFVYKTNLLPSHKIYEHNAQSIHLPTVQNIPTPIGVMMSGYFQRHEYLDDIRADLPLLFHLPWTPDLDKTYGNTLTCAYFLHVRRGDYVNNPFHEMDYTLYYKRAIQQIRSEHPDAIAYVVSNDLAWCKQWDLLKDIPHRFMEEDEVTSLQIMMRCGLGGIAANSSFSWWGLYLNTARPHLILPSKWYPHHVVASDGYYFKEATVVAV